MGYAGHPAFCSDAEIRRMATPAAVGRCMKLLAILLGVSMSLSAANYFVTVVGLGGAPEYDTQFAKWASDLDKQLETGGPDVHVIALGSTASTRAKVTETLARLSTELNPDDAFGLFLIGHGTFDGDEYKLNLPGPDMTGHELAALINKVPAKRQLVVNMTSCSGASFGVLSRKDRVVITATKSGTEKNAPVFARYWVDALRDPAADADKNGTVSALEAFTYAQRKTAAYFESEKLLATEHSMIADNGKSDGVRTISLADREGALAAAFPLIRPASAIAEQREPGEAETGRTERRSRSQNRPPEVSESSTRARGIQAATECLASRFGTYPGGNRSMMRRFLPLLLVLGAGIGAANAASPWNDCRALERHGKRAGSEGLLRAARASVRRPVQSRGLPGTSAIR